MQSVRDERREFQRLQLDPAIPVRLGQADGMLVEIGVLGARVQHDASLPPAPAEIRLSHDGNEIVLRCEIVRTLPSGDGFASGIRFLAAVGESGDRLREMLADLVGRELERRREIPRSTLERAIDADRTIRGKDAAYICYRFENGAWHRRRVFLPEQPAVGFTVARAEDSDEMQRLCMVYEASDEEGRRLIRMFAELSVSAALEIPPRE